MCSPFFVFFEGTWYVLTIASLKYMAYFFGGYLQKTVRFFGWFYICDYDISPYFATLDFFW